MRPFTLLGLLLLTGCATTPAAPPPPTSVAVSAPAAAVRSRVEAAMRASGLTPTATPSGFAAVVRGSADPAWADCRRIIVYDRTESSVRSDWAAPQARAAEVTVGLRPAGDGTLVTVAADFAATYHDRYRNLPTERACPSTGLLERALLGAVQG